MYYLYNYIHRLEIVERVKSLGLSFLPRNIFSLHWNVFLFHKMNNLMSEIVTEEIKLPEANSPPVENNIEPVEGPENETQTAENAEKPIEE